MCETICMVGHSYSPHSEKIPNTIYGGSVCTCVGQGGAGRCDSRLELAMLYYLRSFKKAFITEARPAGMGSMASSPLMDMGAGAPVSKEKVRRAPSPPFV